MHAMSERVSPILAPARGRNANASRQRYSGGFGTEGDSSCCTVVARRYSDGGTPTWFRKKRVKLLCAEKPSSAATSAILPRPEARREIAVSTHSMSRYARGEKPVQTWKRS